MLAQGTFAEWEIDGLGMQYLILTANILSMWFRIRFSVSHLFCVMNFADLIFFFFFCYLFQILIQQTISEMVYVRVWQLSNLFFKFYRLFKERIKLRCKRERYQFANGIAVRFVYSSYGVYGASQHICTLQFPTSVSYIWVYISIC